MPADTTHADTTKKVPKDTVRTPIAPAPVPPLLGIGQSYRWDREAIFASGANTLTDLLQRVPGVTTFRSGWLASPQHAAYLGNPMRVRIFLDGMELDPLDPRAGGVLDMGEAQLWSLEDVAIERGADELRVYLRSWSVTHTNARTETDVLTGDQGTNLYRGFFGQRYRNGLALQVTGQQYGTSSTTDVGGGGDLALTGRFGWARGKWSLDAYAVRSNRTRDEQDAVLPVANDAQLIIPSLKRTRTDAYLRAGYGTPDSGGWGQLMLANTKWSENSPHDSIADNHPNDVVDTTRADLQYVAAAGLTTRGGLRLSATERLHVLKAGKLSATAVRASFEHRLVALSLYAEHRGGDSTSNEEASATFTPVSFFALSGAVGYRHGGTSALGEDKGLSLRAEAGLRVSRAWVSGGILRRPMTVVPGLIAYDTIYTAAPSAAATGVFGSIRGKFYKDFGLDVWGVRWNAPGWYRPRMQSREELYLDTRWLSRFPSGNFGFVGAIGHEYRQDVLFPTAGASETFASPNVSAFFSHSLTTRLEIRILDAHIFWNSIYGISPTTLEYVPGFLQPRQRFIYGVRWEFWN